VLDTGPLGTLCHPHNPPHAHACRQWLAGLQAAGRHVIVPEIADYELRREFLRTNALVSLSHLNGYGLQLDYLPITTAAMHLAAELWARARNAGRPTAHQHALDGDVILAAQALSLGVPVIVATGNPAHLAAFVPVDDWRNIVP
jgi:predicted nucleic acid-binding protein